MLALLSLEEQFVTGDADVICQPLVYDVPVCVKVYIWAHSSLRLVVVVAVKYLYWK